MRLHTLKIEGYKRLKNSLIDFGQATFLIGENNVGKSSVLRAIDILLSSKMDKLSEHDYSMIFDNENDENHRDVEKVILKAEFRDVSEDILEFKGFNKSRLLKYVPESENESVYKIIYKKTFDFDKKPKFEILTYSKKLKDTFENCKKPAEFAANGIDEVLLKSLFGEANFTKNIAAKEKYKLDDIEEIWDIDETDEVWIENPGGIPQNVMSKLPKYILIPAVDKSEEITSKNGALIEIMNELFAEVRGQSENYKKAQEYLEKLSKELDPKDTESEFGKLMSELNGVLDNVFPSSKIHTEADLSDPDKVLKPDFDIQMSSNIKTPVTHQGTGMIRTVVFSLLKFRETWSQRKRVARDFNRSLIIGFEEPEIYLHPNAANQMRNTIYSLVSSSTQIVCSTHSPYMIDLSRKPKQILNNLSINEGFVSSTAFNISAKFKELQEEDKTYVKMLQRVDDYIARMFFAKKVYVVEGDTDEIVLKKTIDLFPEEKRKKALDEIQVIKARGKATIISLAKYLNSMSVPYYVIHDKDTGTEGAEKFNQPILDAIGSEDKRMMMDKYIEDELGYPAPSSNKPLKAFEFVENWKTWDDIPENWKNKMKIVFADYIGDEED